MVCDDAHLNLVGHGAWGRRTRERHRPFGPAGAESGSQRSALDVLVIGSPHEDDESCRLRSEELGGASDHRGCVDTWV
jgi:hypothetical protein